MPDSDGRREPPAEQPLPQNVVTAIGEISERATIIVREEIELAKAEVTEKITKLVKGVAVGVVAGVFAFLGLIYLLHSAAWGLFAAFFDDVAWGFLIVAGVLFILGGIAGFLAARWVRGGAPPTPDMAIEEAQRLRETVTGEPGGQLEAVAARSEAGIEPVRPGAGAGAAAGVSTTGREAR